MYNIQKLKCFSSLYIIQNINQLTNHVHTMSYIPILYLYTEINKKIF